MESFSFHPQIPLLFLGASDNGVVGISVVTMEVVLVIDLKLLIQKELLQDLDKFTVAAVNFLSKSTLVLLVNKIGILRLHIEHVVNNPESDSYLIEFPAHQSTYFNGTTTLPIEEEPLRLKEYDNAILLYYKHYLLDSRDINSSVAKVAPGNYFMAWLSLDAYGTEWRVNLVHFLQNINSQELYSVVISNEGFCLDIYLDYVSPQYLYEL